MGIRRARERDLADARLIRFGSGFKVGTVVVSDDAAFVSRAIAARLLRRMTERLWAPWRAALFAEPNSEGCIFCNFPAEGLAEDEKNLILHRGKSCFVILNKYPYSAGHLMVIPFAHTDDLSAMAPLAREMFEFGARATAALRAVMKPDGFNLGMNLGRVAGAGIPGHGHLHVVPRWTGDNNFMPVLAERRVISEGLHESWVRLKPHFA